MTVAPAPRTHSPATGSASALRPRRLGGVLSPANVGQRATGLHSRQLQATRSRQEWAARSTAMVPALERAVLGAPSLRWRTTLIARCFDPAGHSANPLSLRRGWVAEEAAKSAYRGVVRTQEDGCRGNAWRLGFSELANNPCGAAGRQAVGAMWKRAHPHALVRHPGNQRPST